MIFNKAHNDDIPIVNDKLKEAYPIEQIVEMFNKRENDIEMNILQRKIMKMIDEQKENNEIIRDISYGN